MSTLIGQSLGRYHILEQLGEGGMATVYKAYDTRLERDVAVKVIRRGAFPAEQVERILKRFEREAKSLAKLSHPNIIKVIDYGEYEGSPFLVMEYLPGGTLKQRLGKPIPWQEAVRILIPVAEALEYAHEHNIIHRDIKPANILLTEKGQPMLTDFGIAKILETEETTTLTGTGIGVGTPEYMAPEQWTGQATAQSDIYSFGIVMYEMLTGRKPYTADTPAAILLKQATEPLPRPSAQVSNLPASVEEILLRMLARNTEDRYGDISELLSVLRTGTEKEAVRSNEGSRAKKTASPSKTGHPRPAKRQWVFVSFMALLVAGMAGAYFLASRKAPSPMVGSTDDSISEPTTIVIAANPQATGGLTSSSSSPTQIVRATPATEIRTIVWEEVSAALPDSPISRDNASQIEELVRERLGDTSAVGGLDISPRNENIYFGLGNFVYQLRVADGSVTNTFAGHGNNATCIKLTPDGEYLAARNYGTGRISIWQVADGTLLQTLEGQPGSPCEMDFSADGSILASANEGSVQLWKTGDGSLFQTLQPESHRINGLSFSSDGQFLATGTTGNEVLVWAVTAGSILQSLQGEEYDFGAVAFSPDGSTIASTAYDGTTWVWRTSDWSVLYNLKGNAISNWGRDRGSLLAYSNDGQVLASRSGLETGTSIMLWDLSDGNLLRELAVSEDLWGMSFSADDSFLVIGTNHRFYDDVNRRSHYVPAISIWGVVP